MTSDPTLPHQQFSLKAPLWLWSTSWILSAFFLSFRLSHIMMPLLSAFSSFSVGLILMELNDFKWQLAIRWHTEFVIRWLWVRPCWWICCFNPGQVSFCMTRFLPSLRMVAFTVPISLPSFSKPSIFISLSTKMTYLTGSILLPYSPMPLFLSVFSHR